MEVTHCKKCGRLLRDPISVARGMGPECAGVGGDRQQRYSFRRRVTRTSVYLQETGETTSPSLFSLVRMDEQAEEEIPVAEENTLRGGHSDPFSRFPSDLVDLVLSGSASARIASGKRIYSRRTIRKSEMINRFKVLKEIRRICIESRLAFWPGILKNGQLIACIPCGEDGWKFENSDRILSSTELEAYLTRYGMINSLR